MPRRLLNSKIWTNEKVGSLPFGGRLLFIGLITHADDDGRVKGNPKYLKALCFPYDDTEAAQIQEWVDMLSQLGLTQGYSVNGNSYLYLTGWLEHQSIRKDRYIPSTLPPPDNQLTTKGKPTDNQAVTIVPPNISKGNAIEDNIREEGVVKGVTTPGPQAPAAVVFPEGWTEMTRKVADALLTVPAFKDMAPQLFNAGMERFVKTCQDRHVDGEVVLLETQKFVEFRLVHPPKNAWASYRAWLFDARASPLKRRP